MKIVHEPTVDYADHMGSDLTVVNAARVSFAKHKADLDAADAKLIAYLARHQHWTPFAHCQLTVRVAAPIFVARQLMRSNVGLVINEESRRYVDSEPVFYSPPSWRGRPDGSLKQGSGCALIDQAPADHDWLDAVLATYDAYERMLAAGVAPEQARMVLPLCTMTQWYWTGSLAAFARVCALRLDAHAQSETRDVAERIATIAAERWPISWTALIKQSE